MHGDSFMKQQALPLALTLAAFLGLSALLYGEISVLNLFTIDDISLAINPVDVLLGLTIYLKTSIDFTVFIGHLMHHNEGTKGRVAIELGTAAGNAAGTMAILLIWTFFKEVRWLLVLMIFIAALVLFRLAEDSLEHAKEANSAPRWFTRFVHLLDRVLHAFNKLTAPLLNRIMPSGGMRAAGFTRFWPLFLFSFTVPFVLGLDDFAGYVPLFSIVNVFGFGIGVFLGHMILNILLYISPKRTIQIVKLPILGLLGTLAFVALGVWGFVEITHLIGG